MVRSTLAKLAAKLRIFMYGRYGYDELSRFLLIAGLIIMFISYIPALRFLSVLSLAMYIYTVFRAVSKNIPARLKELNAFMPVKAKIVKKFKLLRCMWRDRKDYKYYTCPSCHEAVRITKPGKGRTITITCAHCRHKFDKKT